MFGLGPATRIYISLDAADIRKGFDGLYGLVRDHLGQDPLSGHIIFACLAPTWKSAVPSTAMKMAPAVRA